MANNKRTIMNTVDFFTSCEVHMSKVVSVFTITTTSGVHVLTTGEYIDTSTIYDPNVLSSYVNSIAVNIITDREAGKFNSGPLFIDGVPANVVNILDHKGEKLLSPDGEQILGIIGIRETYINRFRRPVDNSLQLSFCVKRDDTIVPVMLGPGEYKYKTPYVYTWMSARWKSLPTLWKKKLPLVNYG